MSWWTKTRIAGAGAAATASAWAVPEAMELGLSVGPAAAVGVATVLAIAYRHRLDNQPLTVSHRALRGMVGPHPLFRFRARLGQGRLVLSRTATVRWHPASGDPVPLEVQPLTGRTIGPFTLTVLDRDHIVDGGRLVLTVEVDEGHRTWSAEASYDVADIQAGRFTSGVKRTKRGLQWTYNPWDAAIDDPAMA